MLRHSQKIIHHPRGVFENLVINSLMNVTNLRPTLIVGRRVGLVDMAHFARLRMQNLPVNLKLLRNFQKMLLLMGDRPAASLEARSVRIGKR